VPNLTQIGQEIWKIRVEVHLRPSVKYGFYLSDFYDTQDFFLLFVVVVVVTPVCSLYQFTDGGNLHIRFFCCCVKNAWWRLLCNNYVVAGTYRADFRMSQLQIRHFDFVCLEITVHSCVQQAHSSRLGCNWCVVLLWIWVYRTHRCVPVTTRLLSRVLWVSQWSRTTR